MLPRSGAWPDKLLLEPGRYRVTAYLRGLDIGKGEYNQTTELQFAGNYMPLDKDGTFGWSKLTYVGDVSEKKDFAHPSFGLLAPGLLWVDDVSVEKVGNDVELTPKPIIGEEEKPIEPPGRLGAGGGALPRMWLSQQAFLGPLLRLRLGAGSQEGRRWPAGQACDLL